MIFNRKGALEEDPLRPSSHTDPWLHSLLNQLLYFVLEYINYFSLDRRRNRLAGGSEGRPLAGEVGEGLVY